MRLLAALVLIIIITAIISTVWAYSWIFIFELGENSFNTDSKIHLTGYDNDLEECWLLIQNRTGTAGSSVALSDFSLDRGADGLIESFILHYYSLKDGEWYSYSVIYRDGQKKSLNGILQLRKYYSDLIPHSDDGSRPGGRISVQDSPVKPGVPDFAKEYPLDPGEFLKNLDLLNITYLGYEDSILNIESGNIRGSILYSNEYDYTIYLQESDRLLPLERIVFEDSDYTAFPVTVSKMRCSDCYGTISCSSSDVSTIFLNSRVNNAEFSLLTGSGG